MTMYSATKAYVDFLSRGLAYEYNDKGMLHLHSGKVQLKSIKHKRII